MDAPVSSITKQITYALMNDPRTRGCIIDVGYHAGIVSLTGTVKNTKAFQAAEEIARAQPEVLAVTNELKIG